MKNFVNVIFITFVLMFGVLESQFNMVQLIPDFNINSFYKRSSGFTPHALRFGAWTIAPHGDSLYLGFGTASPAEYDGAILAKIDGDSLRCLGNFSEQGIHCLKWYGDTLYNIGSDPAITDGWDGGNFYRYVPSIGLIEKFRYDSQKKPILPNVVHSWGLSYDSINNVLYMGTGSYDPARYMKNGNDCGKPDDSTIACFGQLWQSTDMGKSWSLNSGDLKNLLSTFRVYDNINFMDNIFIVDGAMDNKNKLKRSSDKGRTWITYQGINPAPVFRMCIFKNQLIVGANFARGMYKINENLGLDTIILPLPLYGSFNIFANIDDKYFAVVFSNSSVKVTMDFINWTEIIAVSEKKIITMSYWSEKKSLILGEMDSAGRLWKVDISEFLSTKINEKLNIEHEFKTYKNKLVITDIHNYDFQFSLFDVLGMNIEISKKIGFSNNELSIDLSDIRPGLYIARIIYQKKVLARKIFIDK